jgi:hypothetical protein
VTRDLDRDYLKLWIAKLTFDSERYEDLADNFAPGSLERKIFTEMAMNMQVALAGFERALAEFKETTATVLEFPSR